MSTESTESELKGQAEPRVVPATPSRKRIGRVWQWFWLGEEVSAARKTLRPPDTEASQRARVAAEIARRIAESPEPFGDSTLAPICELYRESIYWSRLALTAPLPDVSGAEPVDPANAWGPLDSVLRKAVPDAGELSSVQHTVDSGTFVELAKLPIEEQGKLSENLRRAALALISEIDLPQRVLEALWIKRTVRLGLVIALLLVGIGALGWGREVRERARDAAHGRPWRASSRFVQAGGCKSPEQDCAEGADYFFHTDDEQNPWIEFDLGSVQQISAIRVINRKDCCAERAVPLVVEVSTNGKTWKPVARRDAVFSTWLGEFSPVGAHWVRLRLEKRAHFHLSQVRVLR